MACTDDLGTKEDVVNKNGAKSSVTSSSLIWVPQSKTSSRRDSTEGTDELPQSKASSHRLSTEGLDEKSIEWMQNEFRMLDIQQKKAFLESTGIRRRAGTDFEVDYYLPINGEKIPVSIETYCSGLGISARIPTWHHLRMWEYCQKHNTLVTPTVGDQEEYYNSQFGALFKDINDVRTPRVAVEPEEKRPRTSFTEWYPDPKSLKLTFADQFGYSRKDYPKLKDGWIDEVDSDDDNEAKKTVKKHSTRIFGDSSYRNNNKKKEKSDESLKAKKPAVFDENDLGPYFEFLDGLDNLCTKVEDISQQLLDRTVSKETSSDPELRLTGLQGGGLLGLVEETDGPSGVIDIFQEAERSKTLVDMVVNSMNFKEANDMLAELRDNMVDKDKFEALDIDALENENEEDRQDADIAAMEVNVLCSQLKKRKSLLGDMFQTQLRKELSRITPKPENKLKSGYDALRLTIKEFENEFNSNKDICINETLLEILQETACVQGDLIYKLLGCRLPNDQVLSKLEDSSKPLQKIMGELRAHMKPTMLKKDKNDFVTDLLKKVGKRLKQKKDKETKGVDDMKMMQKTINVREKEIKSLRAKMRSILAKLNKSEKETEMKSKQILELDDLISCTPSKPSTPACTIPEHKHIHKELFELKRKMRQANGRKRRLTIQIDNEIQKDQILPKLDSLPESAVICENSEHKQEAPELDNNREDNPPVRVKSRAKSVNQSNTVRIESASAMIIKEKIVHIEKLKKQQIESSKQSKDSSKSTPPSSPKRDLKSDVKKLQQEKIIMEGKIIELEVQLREALQKAVILKNLKTDRRKKANADLPIKREIAKSPALGEAQIMIKEQRAELKLTKKQLKAKQTELDRVQGDLVEFHDLLRTLTTQLGIPSATPKPKSRSGSRSNVHTPRTAIREILSKKMTAADQKEKSSTRSSTSMLSRREFESLSSRLKKSAGEQNARDREKIAAVTEINREQTEEISQLKKFLTYYQDRQSVMAEMPELYSKKNLHQDITKAVSGEHRAKAKAIIRKKLIQEATKLRISLKKIAQHATDRVSSELRKRKGNSHLYKMEENNGDEQYHESKKTLFVSSPNQLPSQLKSGNSNRLSVPVSVRSLTQQIGEPQHTAGTRFTKQTMMDLAESLDKKKKGSVTFLEDDESKKNKAATGPTILMPTLSETRSGKVLLHSNDRNQAKKDAERDTDNSPSSDADIKGVKNQIRKPNRENPAYIPSAANRDKRHNTDFEENTLTPRRLLNTKRLVTDLSKRKPRNADVPRLHLNTQRLNADTSKRKSSRANSKRASGRQRHNMDNNRMKPDILILGEENTPKTAMSKFQLERGLDQDSSAPRHRRKRTVPESVTSKKRMVVSDRPNNLEPLELTSGKLDGAPDRRIRSIKLGHGMKPKKAQVDSVSAKPLCLGLGINDHKAGSQIPFRPSTNHESNWRSQNRRVNRRKANSTLTPRGFNPLPKTQRMGQLTFTSSFSTPRTKTTPLLKRSRKANPRKGLTIGF